LKIFLFLYFFIIVCIFQYYDIFGTINQSNSFSNNKSNDTIVNNQSISNSSENKTNKNIENKTDRNNFNLVSVDISPDRREYTEFESILLIVNFEGNSSELIKLILETRDSSHKLLHKASQIVNGTNLTGYKFLLHPANKGEYNVTVTAIQGTNYEVASTTFNVVPIFETNIAKFVYLAIGFFGALLILITIGIKNQLAEEILRFVFLSGIVASVLASLLFTDLEFGTQAPIGLIKVIDEKRLDDEIQLDNAEIPTKWVFHIGKELTIPIYVIIFGLGGGYIRYLYKTSRLIDEEKNKVNQSKAKNSNSQPLDENIGEKTNNLKTEEVRSSDTQGSTYNRKNVFYESLRDVALFFLAPILSVAVYFLLSAFGLSGENSIYTIAVISFTVGLVTEDVIQTLIRFTQEKLANNKNSDD
jgi:hypothetical protein